MWNVIFTKFFKTKHGYLVTTENQSNTGSNSVDLLTKSGYNPMTNYLSTELKALSGDSWTKGLKQNWFFVENDRDVTNPILINIKSTKIAFFLYVQDWHSTNNFGLKGYQFNGLLGLYFDKGGLKIIPQENTYYPQMMYFDPFYSINPFEKFSVFCLFNYLSTIESAPTIEMTDNGLVLWHHGSHKHGKSVIGQVSRQRKIFITKKGMEIPMESFKNKWVDVEVNGNGKIRIV